MPSSSLFEFGDVAATRKFYTHAISQRLHLWVTKTFCCLVSKSQSTDLFLHCSHGIVAEHLIFCFLHRTQLVTRLTRHVLNRLNGEQNVKGLTRSERVCARDLSRLQLCLCSSTCCDSMGSVAGGIGKRLREGGEGRVARSPVTLFVSQSPSNPD